MKNKFAITTLFLLSYLGFLIATLPATLLLNQLPIAKTLAISGVTGSVWNANVEQITIGKTSIEKVNTELSFWSLLALTPTLSITFGDPLLAGPEGAFTLAISQEKAEISDLKLLVKANEIAQQLTLPWPILAQGNVELTLLTAEIDWQKNNQCITVKGGVIWSKAGVVALGHNIKLGNFNAKIACEDGVLALLLSPKNNLGLTFNAYVRQNGGISGNGLLKPGAKFPPALNIALPFLGKKDNQGRYRLSF